MVDYLLQESFEVKQLNPGGEKFDRVTRIEADGLALEMYMQLDVNNEVYPLKVGDKFKMVLVSTINLDGTPDTGYFMPGRKTIADDFDYVMHGKLYRISEKKDSSGKKNKTEMLVSFAGLLMLLRGEPHFANKFELDQKLFLLMKKL